MSTKFTTNSLATAEHRRRFSEIVGDQHVAVNRSLAELLPIGIGGVVEYFVTATTSQQLVDVARLAIELKMPYQVVAGTTACLPSDVGFPGLIINNQADSMFFAEESRQVVVDSGVSNSTLVMSAANRSYGGIEFLTAIPGSIGGALATNAAYDGKTLRNQCLKEVVVFIPDIDGGKTMTVPITELPDTPYQRIFTSEAGFQPIILTARLQLAQLSQYEIVQRLKQLRSVVNANRGVTFSNFISDIPPFEPRDLRLPKPPDGVRYSLKNPNTLTIQRKKDVSGSAIRSFIEQVSIAFNNGTSALDVRLTYLGYWPEDDEKHSTNAESL